MAGAAFVVADLRAESDELDALVADLPAARWADSTPRRAGRSHIRSHIFCGRIASR
jgi:hypothetical protein